VPFRDEDEFVQWLQRQWPGGERGVGLGIGDDAAIIKPTPGCDLVLSTDLSLENVHFRLGLHPPRSVGHRALARGLSDLAAMGARPRFALVSLTFSPKIGKRWLTEFYAGLGALAQRLGVTVIGGDTSVTGGAPVAVDVVAAGEVKRGKELRRSGARPGDCLFVTGTLGFSALGLEALKSGTSGAGAVRSRSPYQTAAARDSHAALQTHLYPEPRCAAGAYLAKRGLAAAAIDVSDGFARDLGRLCEASGCGARIREDQLPLPSLEGIRRVRDAGGSNKLDLGLYGGEDYELIFTVRAANASRVPRKAAGVAVHEIGEIRSKKGLVLVSSDGRETGLEPRGYDHFRRFADGHRSRS